MSSGKTEKVWHLEALTDVWTGDVDRKGGTLRATGLLGSIRWWFEVLVRGLGGSACDPTHSLCEGSDHCAVCELFGCTGWARKFGFQVMNDNNDNGDENDVRTKAIKKRESFCLKFVALRPIRKEEWKLLDATLRLIADYGALGAKTVYKPDVEGRGSKNPCHRDYGLVRIRKSHDIESVSLNEVASYLSEERDSKVFPKFCKVSHEEFGWASLRHFWCVRRKWLDYEQLNGVVKGNPWLAGAVLKSGDKEVFRSKKIFSFVCPPDPAAGARTFGFVCPDKVDCQDCVRIDFAEMRERLNGSVWGKSGWELVTGEKIKSKLFAKEREEVNA